MDQSTLILLLCQAMTLLLLIISETLPMSDSPYSGILQALIAILESKIQPNYENK